MPTGAGCSVLGGAVAVAGAGCAVGGKYLARPFSVLGVLGGAVGSACVGCNIWANVPGRGPLGSACGAVGRVNIFCTASFLAFRFAIA